MPLLFYCLGACLVLLLYGFVAKQACLVLWLSKPALLNNHYLIGVFGTFSTYSHLAGLTV